MSTQTLNSSWTEKYIPPTAGGNDVWQLPTHEEILSDLERFPSVPIGFQLGEWTERAAILNRQLMNLFEDPFFLRGWQKRNGGDTLFGKLIYFEQAISAAHENGDEYGQPFWTLERLLASVREGVARL